MSHEITVLRSLLRLARRRRGPSLADLVERTGRPEREVRRALFSLARSGLVQRTPAGLRLSLAGLAVAVACTERPRPAAPAPRASILQKAAPLERRRTSRSSRAAA
jgi:DNA-binding IclR family transcriptional regulator